MPSPFLSDAWIAEARALREEYAGRVAAPEHPVVVNLVVRDVPADDAIQQTPRTLDAHLDTSAGELDIELGHVAGSSVTVTLDYATAKSLVVDQDGQAAMQAFLGGRIKIDGDMSQVLMLLQQQQGEPPSPEAAELGARLRAMTS